MFKPQKLSAFPGAPGLAAISLAISGLLILTGCGTGHSSSPHSSSSAPSSANSGKTTDDSSNGPSSGRSTETTADTSSNLVEQSTRGSSSNFSSTSKISKRSEPSEPPENSDIWPEDTYLTGTDLPAGTYLIEQDTGLFPGKVLLTSDDSGSLSSVLDDIGFYNRLYLTIREGEYVQFEGTACPADAAPPYIADDDTYPSGMYLVGKDLAPGLYEIRSSRSGAAGSYSISTDARGNMSNFYQRTTISEPVIQVLEEGQYITLNGAVMRP